MIHKLDLLYRSTQPVQMLMEWRIRSKYDQEQNYVAAQAKPKHYHDMSTKPLPPLAPGNIVRIRDE